ncbi:MAG: type II toxin-antitoxin system VapC family toxin [Chthoniobacterales bacterium]
MLTALDSSALLDVVTGSAKYADRSEEALRKAIGEGGLVVCESVVAEISPAFASTKEITEFMGDWQIRFVSGSDESAKLAGEIFRRYLKRGGRAGRIVVDLLIGAHAVCHADRLLARDRGFLRDYFSTLQLIEP